MDARTIIDRAKTLQPNTVQERTAAMLGALLALAGVRPEEFAKCLAWTFAGTEPPEPKTRDESCTECPHNDSDGTICDEPKCPRYSKNRLTNKSH